MLHLRIVACKILMEQEGLGGIITLSDEICGADVLRMIVHQTASPHRIVISWTALHAWTFATWNRMMEHFVDATVVL